MTYVHRALRTGAALAAVAILASGANAQVQIPATQASNLKATPTRQKVTPVPCNSISACNQIIALCAAGNGTWIPDGRQGPEGQPAGGICYLP